MEQTDSCQRGGGRGDWTKEDEEISQRTQMFNPWTETMVWCGDGQREGGRGLGGGCKGWGWGMGTSGIASTIKIKKTNIKTVISSIP